MKTLVALTSIIGFLMVVLPGPLYQFVGIDLGLAFTMLRYGVFVAGAAIILIILQALLMRKSIRWGTTTLYAIMALIAVALPVSMMGKASSVPAIHDITTDITNPPEFVAIAPLRADAPNDINYAGGEVATQQLKAYPEIRTQLFAQPIENVYAAAEQTVDAMGWERVSTGADENTIEATDTTLWFGFKDDVVIRLTAKDDDTLVDMRSKSRVGRSDLGKNAERVNAFMEALRQRTDASVK